MCLSAQDFTDMVCVCTIKQQRFLPVCGNLCSLVCVSDLKLVRLQPLHMHTQTHTTHTFHAYLPPPPPHTQTNKNLSITHIHTPLNLFPWCKIMSVFIFVCVRGFCLQSSLQYECSGTLCSDTMTKWNKWGAPKTVQPLKFTDRGKFHLFAQMYSAQHIPAGINVLNYFHQHNKLTITG